MLCSISTLGSAYQRIELHGIEKVDQSVLPVSPAIIAALITSFAAVVCVPLINRALTQYFDKRSRITVSYKVADSHPSSYVLKLFGNIYDRNMPEVDRKIRSILSHTRAYIRMEIVNEGSTAVKNLTISADDAYFSAAMQIENSDETFVIDAKNPYLVGDLQPKLRKIIHLYIDAASLGVGNDSFLRRFHVSADQIDRIKYVKGDAELVPMTTMLKRMQYVFYFLLAWFLLTFATYIPQFFRSFIH